MSDVEASDNNTDSVTKILLDTPTKTPALGYREIGSALATIISQSEARFTVGIFGGWGAGKTTLMTAIKETLPKDCIVVVDFNAWRFEREPQLLLPLLDVIREALVKWSSGRDEDTKQKVRSMAARVGRVVRGLATGLSGQIGLPGAATVNYDVGKAIDALSSGEESDSAQSLYVAAFRELESTFSEFSQGGIDRVVIFVDDLDRCLPSNALDVLESIKLFFDLPGFVFVVGIDEDVVERAIRAKFTNQEELHSTPTPDGGDGSTFITRNTQRLGREYIKKIFQVPYALPAMVPQQLDDLLGSMYDEAALAPAQRKDLEERLRPYIGYVAVKRRVNPREVKRFINAYILQTLVRPQLDRDTVLALQTLAFRTEWEELYDAILSDSALFIDALNRYCDGNRAAFEELSPNLGTLPSDLGRYLRSPSAAPLTKHSSLDIYLSSLREISGPASWFYEAYRSIGQVRRAIQNIRKQKDIGDSEMRALGALVVKEMNEVQSLYFETIHPEASDRLDLALEDAITYAEAISKGGGEPSEPATDVDNLENVIQRVISEIRLVRDSSTRRL